MKSLIGKEKLHLSLQISDGSIFSFYSLFLISFSSLRMRDDSCSGVGVLKESERPPSAPEGGVGSLCLKRSIHVFHAVFHAVSVGKETENSQDLCPINVFYLPRLIKPLK